MARMIPPTIHADTKSEGEIEVFRRLRDDPATHDWIVLHSLDVAEHRKQISGEIDFVVVIPHKGVLCIEVKACHHLRRSGGQWYYGASIHPDPRGPFKQASEAMHSIRKRLATRRPDLSHIVFWSAVILPYVTFDVMSEEWYPWQLIDSRAFRMRPLAKSLEYVLDQARMRLTWLNIGWFYDDNAAPDAIQCESIANTLRPDFEFFESPKSRDQRLHDELKYYTSEQFSALDAMESNPRVAFCGPAGTGKTMLAIETARRSAAAGRRVLLLCYNRLLGKWLEEQVRDLQPSVVCKTLHSYMLTLTGRSSLGTEPKFWQDVLPELAVGWLLEHGDDESVFDELVVDEAQDMLRDSYLDFLDLSLRGGLATGRWRLFGDFEKQSIYDSANITLESFLQTRVAGAPVYMLRTNCRNTPRVAELVHLLGGLQPPYARILRPDNQIAPELHYYASMEQQKRLLIQVLQKLYSTGFSGNEIVVLSFRSAPASVAASIDQSPWRERLKPLDTAGRGYIGYSSVHAFKGLEAPAIIVTDVEQIGNPGSMALLYIAMTRALDQLVLIMDEHVKQDMRRLLSVAIPEESVH